MRVLFTCGGTGGHIYPAVALYHEFKLRGENEYLFVGSDYGLEKDIFEKENISSAVFISSRGIKRSFSLRNLAAVFCNIKAYFQARKIFKGFKPDIVIGTGAYPAFHMTYMAKKTKTPYFLIENNAVPGLVTKLFYKHAEAVITEMPSRFNKVKKPKERVSDKKTVLIIGGSCGSKYINAAAAEMVNEGIPYNVIWSAGKKEYESAVKKINRLPENVKIYDYINDIGSVLAVSDIIVARAGAMTIQEIKEFGVPAVLVPFAGAAGNHQYKNALELKNLRVAEIIEEKAINGAVLRQKIDLLADERRTAEIVEIYNGMDRSNRNGSIYDEIIYLTKEKNIC